MSTRSKKRGPIGQGRLKRSTAGPITKRANRAQDPRVQEALAEARREEERLERRIARERAAGPNGPALGAQFADLLTPEPEPEPVVEPTKRPMFEQVRIVEPDRPKPRAVQKAEILGETRTVKVNPDVWAYVLESGCDPKCVQVISEHEIICWNRPGPWPVPQQLQEAS